MKTSPRLIDLFELTDQGFRLCRRLGLGTVAEALTAARRYALRRGIRGTRTALAELLWDANGFRDWDDCRAAAAAITKGGAA